ncbi:MAG: tetratricopeptide repeat protein [Verrucomicrobiota bacterium]
MTTRATSSGGLLLLVAMTLAGALDGRGEPGLAPGPASRAGRAVAGASPVPGDLADLERRHRADPTNGVVLLDLGRLYHWKGSEGDREAVGKAEECLERLGRLEPSNARGRALLGSTRTLQARDARMPTTKLKLARRGLAEMDAAVREAPDDPEVRFTRVCNNISLPGLFRRQAFIEEDLAWLGRAAQAQPPRLEPGFRQWVALYHGLWLERQERRDEARRRWSEALALVPGSPAAGRLQAELDRTGAPASRGKGGAR